MDVDIEKQFKNDQFAETEAIKMYNDSIRSCSELGDNGTIDLLESILTDEEKHLNSPETQIKQIKQLELKNYLIEQTD